MTDNQIKFAVSNYAREAGQDVKGAILVISKDMIAINALIKRLQTENKELHNAFINKERIKVVQARAIREFTEKLICEIVNRPYSKDSADVFYMNGRVDRQNEIIDIIKDLSSECSKSVSSCQQNNCKECQYYKEHQEYECLPYDIGDTVYCVNGYGSQRYIKEFTVAEIRITKDGIWLTDTKGMEWLARVCHFSRESAERELNSSKVALPVEVGDTVFLPYITDYETIEQYEVIEVGQDENGQFFRVNDEEGNKIHDYEIGTTVFLTHKEAVEKALQMTGGNKTETFYYNSFMKTEWGNNMKKFIYRVKNGLNYERSYDNEPLFFKIFLCFTYVFVIVGKAIFCVVCFSTVPIWILPYMIYWCKANKSDGEDDEKA